jgi:hypothetical protein
MYWKLNGRTAVAVETPMMIEKWGNRYMAHVGWRRSANGGPRRLFSLGYGASRSIPHSASIIMFDTFGQALAALRAIPLEDLDTDDAWWLVHLDAVPSISTTQLAAAWGVSDLDELAVITEENRG